MARIVIILEDNDRGNVDISAESDPPFPGIMTADGPRADSGATSAQCLAMGLLAAATDLCQIIGDPTFEGVETEGFENN